MAKRKKKKRKSRTAGLSAKQWKALRARVIQEQNYRCAICGERGHDGPSKRVRGVGRVHVIRRLYLDHDHKTDRVRGALCFRCNHRLLGRGLEDATLHRLAALYLQMKRDWRKKL